MKTMFCTNGSPSREYRRWRTVLNAVIVLAMSIGSNWRLRASPDSTVTGGATSFACDLYGRLKETPGNLFFSPYSISTCLAMTYAGARGDTEKQMAQVLHFGGDQAQVATGFGDLPRQLAAAGNQQGIELSVANALWAQQGHPFLPAFLKIARTEYQANVNQADFKTQSASATRRINDWVAQKTKDKIKDILSPGSLNAQTRLVLANAIYFKGRWADQFQAARTLNQPFHLAPGTQVEASLMHRTGRTRYMDNDAFQAVELPYQGNRLTMMILLPRAIDGCRGIEAQLSADLLAKSLAQMKMQEVELFVPKFQMTSSFELGNTLSKMGMAQAFGPEADFSGMDGMKDLFISAVLHKAWVEVTEEGTEAAAATVTTMRALAIARPIAPVVFRADHPFIFLIRDTQSGCVLFLGRLANPGK
jgi:serpin B